MNIGTFLIGLSLFSAVGAIILFGLFFSLGDKALRYYAHLLTLASFIFISLAILLLTYYFLSSNFDYHYVWEYSSKDSPWYLQLSGVWAGQSGSFFFWTWLILFSIAIEVFMHIKDEIKMEAESKPTKKKDKKKSKLRGDLQKKKSSVSSTNVFDWTITIAMAVVVVFIFILLVKNPFTEIHNITMQFEDEDGDPYLESVDPLKYYPDGKGLNPLLRNFWMVTHPPLLFIGYAMITIPFAASMAYLISNDKRWSKISLQWSRIAWLFLTLGIGIGAIWAYVELNFGGYWAWDPVEVGSLIPWFTLTAFMHAQIMNKKSGNKGEYKIIVAVLGMATFILVIFATYITRSGIWGGVHAWTETTVGNILKVLMISTLIFGSIVIFWRFSKEEEQKDFNYSLDFITMFSTILLLTMIAIVMFIGLFVSQGDPNPVFYETRIFPFALPLVFFLAICLIWRYVDKENLLYALGWVILASIAAAFVLPKYVFPGTPEDFYGGISSHRVVAFFLPPILFAIGATIYKIKRSIRKQSIRATLRMVSPHLIHLGIVLMIISYSFSMKMAEDKTVTLAEGQTFDFKDYKIKLVSIEESTDNEKIIQDYTFEIKKNGNLIATKHPKYVYYSDAEEYRYEVAIKMRITEDIYINLINFDPDGNNQFDSATIKIQTVPMMGFLWGGMILMAVGITFIILIEYGFGAKEREVVEPESRKTTKEKEKPRENKKKDHDKYEKMLEEELKNI